MAARLLRDCTNALTTTGRTFISVAVLRQSASQQTMSLHPLLITELRSADDAGWRRTSHDRISNCLQVEVSITVAKAQILHEASTVDAFTDDEGSFEDSAGKLSAWSAKARTENVSDWKRFKEIHLWVFGISVCRAKPTLLYRLCSVCIVAYFTTFLWLSLWKGWFYRFQCWWRSWISCDVTHYDGRSLWLPWSHQTLTSILA